MSLPDSLLEDIRHRISLVDLISRHVRLTRQGREHQGLCPFHKEKTPSFRVYDDHYHCFGCGAHGSLFDFVMQTERLTFPQAVERLADLVGVARPQPQAKDREEQQRRQTLLHAIQQAALFYEERLQSAEGKAARDYLCGRGIEQAAIRRFRLGYAPPGRAALRTALAGSGFTDAVMTEAGLVVQPDDQAAAAYDRFRSRAIFPIADGRGRLVGFGGRLLGPGEPKYLNSPETPLFRKGHLLYGLPAAAEAARRTGRLIVVEGYMDAIGLALAGYEETVAPLGTAVTAEQLQELWRLAPSPIVCFDPDPAGRRAATKVCERALPLLRPGLGLRFAFLATETGDDPDAVIRRYSKRHLDAALNSAVPISYMLVHLVTGGTPPATPEARAMAIDQLRKCADAIVDPAVRKQFHVHIREVARNLVPSPKEARGERPERLLPGAQGHHNVASSSSIVSAEQTVLAILINHSELFPEVEELIGRVTFSQPELEVLRLHLVCTLSGAQPLSRDAILESFEAAGLNFEPRAVLGIPWLRSVSHFAARRTRDQENAHLMRKWFNKDGVDDDSIPDGVRGNLRSNLAVIRHSNDAADPGLKASGGTEAALRRCFAHLDDQAREEANDVD